MRTGGVGAKLSIAAVAPEPGKGGVGTNDMTAAAADEEGRPISGDAPRVAGFEGECSPVAGFTVGESCESTVFSVIAALDEGGEEEEEEEDTPTAAARPDEDVDSSLGFVPSVGAATSGGGGSNGNTAGNTNGSTQAGAT